MPVLYEYEPKSLDLTRVQAEALQRTGVCEVSPLAGGRWQVTPSSTVGTIAVADVKLLIRPKINPENLFLLLEPGLPRSAWRQESFDYDVTSDLLPSVIAFFARTVETTLGRGVLRSYVSRDEPLIAIRGRLDVAAQFAQGGVLSPVACTFDDYSEDIAENRILRAAIRRALRVPRIDPLERRRLLQQLGHLDSVSDVAVGPDAVDAIQVSRLNRHYSPALGLSRLILANLTLADARGSTSAASFTVDMNHVFQRFLTERLRRELRGVLDVRDEPTVHLGAGRTVPMKPDLVFQQGGAVRHVGDIKYKLARDARGRSGDYYQLLAYTTALSLPAGVLVYCRGQGDAVHHTISVRNAGTTLSVRAIDLTGTPEQVDAEITALASAIRDAALRS
ncbi:MAG TPA: hypothetical protein GXZ60_03040 [Intrasporangiaceae bacterium]|nr:hypothetical protein [Intrasporangiaceae bacterium]